MPIPVYVDINVSVKGINQLNNAFSNLSKKTKNISKEATAQNARWKFSADKLVKNYRTNAELFDVLRKNTEKISYAQQTGVDVQKVFTREIYNSNKAAAILKSRGVGGIDKMINHTIASTHRFKVEWLSIMFFGMFLQRMFGGLFNQMLNVFRTIDKKGVTPLSRAMTRMQASFTFLQFSIVNAMQPFLIGLIDAAVTFFDWIANWPPELQSTLGILVGILAVLGSIAFLTGTIKLFTGAFGTLLAGIGITKEMFGAVGKGIGKISTTLKGSWVWAKDALPRLLGTELGVVGGTSITVGKLIGGGLIIYGVFELSTTILSVYDDSKLDFNEALDLIKSAALLSFGVLIAFGMEAGVITAVLSGAIIISWCLFHNFGEAISDFSRYVESEFRKFFPDLKIPKDIVMVPTIDTTQMDQAVTAYTAIPKEFANGWNKTAPILINDVNSTMLEINEYLPGSGSPEAAKGPLSSPTFFARGAGMILNFSKGVLSMAPLLKDVLVSVFSNAMKATYEAFHSYIQAMVAEVNRMIEAIRALQAARASAYASTPTNVSISQTVNVSGAQDINAVARAVEDALNRVAYNIKRNT